MYTMNMPIKHLESIINSGLFQYVRKSDYISAFEQLAITERSFRKGETILYQGDLIDSICIVESGSVRGEKTYPNGDIHIVSVFEEGSIVALEIPVSRKKTTRRRSFTYYSSLNSASSSLRAFFTSSKL